MPMLSLMKQNIDLNQLNGAVDAAVYDWGAAVPETLPANPDIILAADCVYFEPAFPLLQQTLKDLIGAKTSLLLLFQETPAGRSFLCERYQENVRGEGSSRRPRQAYLLEGQYILVSKTGVPESRS